MNEEIGNRYIAWCRYRLMNQYWPRVQRCVEELPEEFVWWRAHETNNSVGNLLLHLTGNVRQFVIAALGGSPDTRDKVREFATREHTPKAVLLAQLQEALLETDRILSTLEPRRLLTVITVQNRERSVLEVLSVVVEHFALHVGQIIFVTKLKTGKDLKL